MEDEEGYMVLNLKPKKELGKHNHLSQMQDTSRYPHCQRIALLIGWAANVFLVITVIVLAFQMKQQTNGTEKKTYLETVSHLKQFLCKPLDNRATENSRCRLCPQNWFLRGNKCYWISDENRTWHESEKDCRAKLAHMLVIEDQDEVAFIQSIVEGAHLLWIGLTATLPERKWTWVNGSPLDDKILQGITPVEANSCGQLNENRIVPEACSAVARWICKTNSLLI